MSSYVFQFIKVTAKAMRSVGLAIDNMGKNIEVTKYTEKLVPSTRLVAVDGKSPTLSSTTFVAPSASVVGNVTLGKGSSVWYSAAVRGDVNTVNIGDYVHIFDRAVVHVAKIQGDHPTNIGSHVNIGSGAIIHAATLHDGVSVGEMSQVLDGAVVEENAQIGPGSIVTPGTVVKAGELWAGSPAKKVRDLSNEEINYNKALCMEATELAALHSYETSKDKETVENDRAFAEAFEDGSFDPKDLVEYDDADVLGQGQPGRIFRSVFSHPEQYYAEKQKQIDTQSKN